MSEEEFFYQARERMVAEQLAGRDIRDPRVLEAMRTVPRHIFVPPEHRRLAYADGPLPIGFGQTISQPYIVAAMTQRLRLQGAEVVLEVGTGSGYQGAILAYIAAEVHTIERYELLARFAARLYSDLGLENIHVHVGDGSLGLPEFAPYGGILVTAGAPETPQPLLEQLAVDGRMVIPVGGQRGQFLELWIRRRDRLVRRRLAPVAFVPLRGQYGWSESNEEAE